MEEKDIAALVEKLDKKVSRDQLKQIISGLRGQMASAKPEVKKQLEEEIRFWEGIHNAKPVTKVRSSTEGLRRHIENNKGSLGKFLSSRGMLGLITKEGSTDNLYAPEGSVSGSETRRTQFMLPGEVAGPQADETKGADAQKSSGSPSTPTSKKVKRTEFDLDSMPVAPKRDISKAPITSLPDFLKKAEERINPAVIKGGIQSSPDSGNEELIRRAKLQKTLNNISAIGNLAINLGDMFAARRDVNKAENLRDNITTPSYAVRGQNKGLLRELRDAETKRINPYGIVAPVQDQINLGFNQDISTAQSASGGQASTFGSLAGASALRRDKNLNTLGQVAAGAVGTQDARIAGLLSNQIQDDSNRDYLSLFKYQQDQDRSLQEGFAVGDAIASSRLRKIQSRNDLLNNLITSPVFDVNSYKDILRTSLTSRK